MKNEFLEKLQQLGSVDENVSFGRLTTYKVGGNARYVVYPKNAFSLLSVMELCRKEVVPFKVLGNGSNILCSDNDYDGVVIKLNRGFSESFYDGNSVTVGAGYSIVALSYDAMRRGLSGLEFASGIPGTIGGCLFMNAGAYKSSMSDIVEKVQVVRDGDIIWMDREECEFAYRSSVFHKHPDWIIVACRINLVPRDKEKIAALMKERQERRFASQPLNYPSAGSVFRNPEGRYAWQYVDMIGYRGRHYGDAWVSEKHSNFIINKGNATAGEIAALIDDIREEVRKQYDVELIMEVEKFNW